MISSYRLGDLVLISLNETEENEILNEHPNSIGYKFIMEKRKNSMINWYDEKNNVELFTRIALEHLEQNLESLPKDISNSTVIHLRLGDVVCGNQWHEQSKRPFSIDYIKSLLKYDTNKKYVIGNCFFAKTSSQNYEECIQKSNEYLHTVVNELNAEYFDSKNADIDFCLAIKSKLFLQGRGFFSKLIVKIRNNLGLENIETKCFD